MNDIETILPLQRGHFLLESGHHGHLWLDLELLCFDPQPIRRLADRLAEAMHGRAFDLVCGPLNEGAFVALYVAERLGVPFAYTERVLRDDLTALFPYRYELPPALRPKVAGRKVAIVNDVINAGSAVRGTYQALIDSGATVALFASLVVLGSYFEAFGQQSGVPLKALAHIENEIWEASACPLCAQGVALERK